MEYKLMIIFESLMIRIAYVYDRVHWHIIPVIRDLWVIAKKKIKAIIFKWTSVTT